MGFLQFLHDPSPPPLTRNSIELLAVAMARLKELMDDLDGEDLFGKKLEMDEDGFVPIGLRPELEKQEDEKDSKFFVWKTFFCVKNNKMIHF